MAAETEIFLDRETGFYTPDKTLLYYYLHNILPFLHYVVKYHDTALFRIQFICWDQGRYHWGSRGCPYPPKLDGLLQLF